LRDISDKLSATIVNISNGKEDLNDGSRDISEKLSANIVNISNGKEDLNDGSRDISEKLSAALVNVNAKEDLVKQHAKVAEEAIAGMLIITKYMHLLLSVILGKITNYTLLLDYHSILSWICVDIVRCVSTNYSAANC